MKKTILLTFLTGTVWLAFETFTAVSNGGGPPLGKTGGTGEGLCTECHNTNPVNTGAAQVKADYSYNGSLDSFYNPDFGQSSYAIEATLVEQGSESSGIEMTMLDKNGVGAGSFTANNQSRTATAINNGKPYFYHTKKDNPNPNANQWVASWTPPTTNVGTLTLYTAINGTDDDGTEFGDYIYTLKSDIKIDPGFNGVEWQKSNAMRLAVFPTTTSDKINITYTNTKDQMVTIDLYDIKGNKVQNFLQANQHQGDNTYSFDLSGVAKGTYLIRMTAGQQEVSKKIFVL